MTNMNEYLTIEKGIREGLTMSWTLYEDMNALYSDAMTQYMPTEILEIPIHLHDFFADYSLALEKQIVPENWLSLYNERLIRDKAVRDGKYVSGEKLLQTLYTKKNYMKEYIEENIRKCKIAKATGDEFGVMYYKLKNNVVFGKQMENVLKHIRVELFQTEEDKKIKPSIKISPSCPSSDCKKEVESAVINSSEKQKEYNNLMDISLSLYNESPLFPDPYQ
ncbi:12636_t:CDS:2 [Funneliformis geosporum]|nr:12636_t:CDS:2 [Funneliformis geosporum]